MHTEYFTFRCSLKKKDRIIYYHITDIELNRRYLIDITLSLQINLKIRIEYSKQNTWKKNIFIKKKSSILRFIS